MNETLHRRMKWVFAAAALLGVGSQAAAQRRQEDIEPQLFRIRYSGASLGVYAEGNEESYAELEQEVIPGLF